MSCIACPNGETSSFTQTQTERVIRGQVRVASSLYTVNLAAVSAVTPDIGKAYAKKHDSYARLLAKRKGILKGSAGIIRTNCSC